MSYLDAVLADMAAAREHLLGELTSAFDATDTAALILIRFLARGGGDAWSGIDAILVPAPDKHAVDLA